MPSYGFRLRFLGSVQCPLHSFLLEQLTWGLYTRLLRWLSRIVQLASSSSCLGVPCRFTCWRTFIRLVQQADSVHCHLTSVLLPLLFCVPCVFAPLYSRSGTNTINKTAIYVAYAVDILNSPTSSVATRYWWSNNGANFYLGLTNPTSTQVFYPPVYPVTYGNMVITWAEQANRALFTKKGACQAVPIYTL